MLNRRLFLVVCLSCLSLTQQLIAAAAQDFAAVSYRGLNVVERNLTLPSGVAIKVELKLSSAGTAAYSSPWVTSNSPQLPAKTATFDPAVAGLWSVEVTYKSESNSEQRQTINLSPNGSQTVKFARGEKTLFELRVDTQTATQGRRRDVLRVTFAQP